MVGAKNKIFIVLLWKGKFSGPKPREIYKNEWEIEGPFFLWEGKSRPPPQTLNWKAKLGKQIIGRLFVKRKSLQKIPFKLLPRDAVGFFFCFPPPLGSPRKASSGKNYFDPFMAPAPIQKAPKKGKMESFLGDWKLYSFFWETKIEKNLP